MRAKTIAKVTAAVLAWLAYVFFGSLIVDNSLGYFGSLNAMVFVEEKAPVSQEPLWRAALVLHVAGGLLCLVSATLQFFRRLTRRWPALHRTLGNVYAFAVMCLLCPSGLYLALYANGGFLGKSGFLLLGALTYGTTSRGVSEMAAGRPRSHARWMIRSFAMATTAITFRLYHLALGYADWWSPATSYVVALWLSLAGNALAAEWCTRLIPLATSTPPKPNAPDHHHEPNLHAPLLSRAGTR